MGCCVSGAAPRTIHQRIYTVILLWRWTNNKVGPGFDSSGEIWWLFQHYFLVCIWSLLHLAFVLVQGIVLACINCLHLLPREKHSEASTPCYGGTQALEAVLSYSGSSHKVASAIIESKALSRGNVECSIQLAMSGHDPLVLRLLTWTLRNGYTKIMSSLLELRIPPTQFHRRRKISPIECTAYFGHIDLVEHLIIALEPTDPLAIEQVGQAFIATTIPDHSDRLNKRHKHRLQIQSILLVRVGDVNVRDHQGRTALSYAVSGGDLSLVSQLLERGANIGLLDFRGRSPLSYLADEEECVFMCNRLLSAGADVDHQDDDGNTVMLRHAAFSNTRPVRALLVAGADPHIINRRGEACLQLAARYCMIEMMQLLIDKGADVEASFLSSTPPLLQACKAPYERAAGLKLLLENRADPNRVDNKGRTPLHNVCLRHSYCGKKRDSSDHLHSLELLIEHSADVNATYTEQKKGRSFDVSIIVVAAEHVTDRVGAIQALLAAGASPNGLDEKGKPVIVTAYTYGPRADGDSPKADMIELLLDAGADLHYQDELNATLLHYALDVNAKDIYGRTPLHYACQDGHWMTIDAYRTWKAAGMYSGSQYRSWHCSIEPTLAIYVLLAHGADTTADDQFRCTLAHIAAKAGNPRIMAMLLLQAGLDLMYEFSDDCERLSFHYAVLSVEVVRLLLHSHSTGEISSDRYWSVEKQREESLATLQCEISKNNWHKISRERHQKAHPNENVDDASYPLRWRRGRCNAQDTYGNTPLHYAALASNVEIVKDYITVPDVDPAVRNNDGETPFDFSFENRDCALVLRSRLLELGIEALDTVDLPIHSKSKSRRAADNFVASLGKS